MLNDAAWLFFGSPIAFSLSHMAGISILKLISSYSIQQTIPTVKMFNSKYIFLVKFFRLLQVLANTRKVLFVIVGLDF